MAIAKARLSKQNQSKAARKIAINGSVAMVMYFLSTISGLFVSPSLTAGAPGATVGTNWVLWLSMVPLHAAILASIAAVLWPMYLVVLQERKTS